MPVRAPAAFLNGRGSPTRRGWTSSASASTTARTSRCPRPRSCWPQRPRNQENPPDQHRHGSLERRSGPSFRGLHNAGSHQRRPRRKHGRTGACLESFPLFGQPLEHYDEYFEDRLELQLRIRDENPDTWNGTTGSPLTDAGIWPRPAQDALPIWAAVGGTPASAVCAGSLGLPLYSAILGHPEG